MYIKLTKLDNSPIWINSSFVVTIEPARNGTGSIVVPIGDGLDYDVRETPEAVLALLAGAPEPVVVPVPPPPGLTKTPDDVSPEKPDVSPTPEKPVRKTRTRKTKETSAEGAGTEAVEKSARKPRARKTARKSAEAGEVSEPPPAEAPPAEPPPVKPVSSLFDEPIVPSVPKREPGPSGLTDDQMLRLQKMAPGSVRKLQNTLIAQFRLTDVDAVVAELEARGLITLDRDHIVWSVPIPAY